MKETPPKIYSVIIINMSEDIRILIKKGRHHWMEYFEEMKPGVKGNHRLFQECHPQSHEALERNLKFK